MHIPGAIAGRVFAINAVAVTAERMNYYSNIDNSPDAEDKNVIVINAPCWFLFAYAPSYKAYHHQPLPKTMRMLVPGLTSFDVQRTDDKTLVIQSQAPDIFSCDNFGPVHVIYAVRAFNLLGSSRFKKGDRGDRGSLTVEVLEMDSSDLPSRVAFRFDHSLDSPDFHWLQFGWQTLSYETFQIPAIGQSVTLSGPLRKKH
jgi:hypothetical protein